jgi:Rad3-related DNA helicase
MASSVDRLELDVERFLAWREEKARGRSERDDHSLLREFVERAAVSSERDASASANRAESASVSAERDALLSVEPDSAEDDASVAAELVESRRALAQHGNELDASLAELAERIDTLPLRGVPRLRRALDLVRQDLVEMLAAIEAWIPLEEGRPAFRPRTFYDVERDARGDIALASRVLLPNEFLGRNYLPSLATGVFLSATTWLQESFEPARAYLGLDRAAEPGDDEERPARIVRTFRAPEVFDYSRVLVAVPRDAPSIAAGKDVFLDYVRRFVAHLGERTRGRMLVLFTNAQDTVRVGEELAGFFRARRIPLWFQNMEGAAKEEITELFRSRVDSVLLGVDTFWYGADFPGETLEYLVIVKLPYGVPDRYHHAQCAALGVGEQRRRIYLPRALGKFRQGFGRLMRRESDRGCVFILDGRVLEPRHRFFLKELPIAGAADNTMESARAKLARINARAARNEAALAHIDAGSIAERTLPLARLVRGDTERCIHEALLHMNLLEDVRKRGLDWSFASSESSRSGRNAARAVGVDGDCEPSALANGSHVDVERADGDVGDPAHELEAQADASEATRDGGLRATTASKRSERAREIPLEIPFEDLPF